MHHKGLWCAKELTLGGAQLVRVNRHEPGSQAKKPRRVQSRWSKQRDVDLTTDGLWAMPLYTGWVPVKEHRLQEWEKLKKYIPVHKQGDVCPNGVPALPEKATQTTTMI